MGVSAGTLSGVRLASRGRPAEFRFSHRFLRLGAAGRAPYPALFDVSVHLHAASPARNGARAGLRAGACFLIDALYGAVPPGELARMIGRFACAWEAEAGSRVVEVTLRNDRGLITAAHVCRPVFAVEHNGFGAAHILYENEVLGLYVLEVAPGRAIPAHFHRVMQEAELVLDANLLLQGRPVRPGDAFAWSAGQVHEYRNPTAAPKRILCIDRPKFIPEDEVVAPGNHELAPARPERSYSC